MTIGGRASRLRASGARIPPFETKSFLWFAGKPALYWTLTNLRRAGISSLVLAGERDEILQRGYAIAIAVGFAAEQVALFRDQGAGVHGIPHHADHLLATRFIFEAGHGMAPPDHYRRLTYTPAGQVAYSTFPPRRDNSSRTPVAAKAKSTRQIGRVVALPYCLDDGWNDRIVDQQYDIRSAIRADVDSRRAVFVDGHFEPEFDELSEYRRVQRRMRGMALAALAVVSA